MRVTGGVRLALLGLLFLGTVLGQELPGGTLRSSDPARLRRVYELLGQKVEEGGGSIAFVVAAPPAFAVEKGRPPKASRKRALQILVPDVSRARAALKRGGFAVEPVLSRPGRRKGLRLRDPDGRLLHVRTAADAARWALPDSGALNPFVLEVLKEYPTDGTHPYHWPKRGGWRGCTRDLVYDGRVVSKGDAEGRAYCCGLTFEVFLEAWRRWCLAEARPFRIKDLDVAGIRRLQSQWFGSAADKSCLRTALVDNGLGTRIERWSDAKAGDFVQLWRASGSGHSVIFLDWVRKGRKIVGLRYWSTQKSTKGIGERVERFGETGRGVDRRAFYLCRVGVTD